MSRSLAISTCVLASLSALVAGSTVQAQLPAFPGAEGFGALATGGRGGQVYIVTNLNDAGPGSLRDAVSQSNRTVVFGVGGTINLNSRLVFSNNITVAGQTAPGGIAVYGDGVSLSHRNNIVIQHMTFRQGIDTPTGVKALNITEGHNIILDHVSLSWGRWDTLGITGGATNITIQNSILSEAIDPQRFGALVDASRNITLAHNLWINNQSRNPKGKGDLQFINNVVYNWGSNGYVGGHSSAVWKQDLINNYFIAGPSSSTSSMLTQFTDTDWVHHTGNLVDLNRNGELDGRAIVNSDFRGNSSGDAPTFISAPQNHPLIPVTVYTAEEAYERVLGRAGNSRYRDSVDQRVVAHVASLGTQGAVIQNEWQVGGPAQIVGGTPPLDTNRDGIADDFKLAHGFGIHDVIHNVNSGDGYTWLEKYIHTLTDSDAPQPPPPPPTLPWTISTAFGRGADAEVTENTTNGITSSGGNGTGPAMNARWMGASGDRNEYILLRFDLAEVVPDSIHSATLQLTAFRDMQNFALRVYGLNPDAPGQLWDEQTIDFVSAPALNYDGNSGTRGLDLNQVTLLGEFTTAGFSEGQAVNFFNPNLTSFLNLMADDEAEEGGVATLLIERITENSGQSRFATKEATHLQSTMPGSVAAGTYAPQLLLQLLEPDIGAVLPGDFNNDGAVDAADYTAWRDGLGTDYDPDHYHDWRNHFGATLATAAARSNSAVVPEPGSYLLMVIVAWTWRTARRPAEHGTADNRTYFAK